MPRLRSSCVCRTARHGWCGGRRGGRRSRATVARAGGRGAGARCAGVRGAGSRGAGRGSVWTGGGGTGAGGAGRGGGSATTTTRSSSSSSASIGSPGSGMCPGGVRGIGGTDGGMGGGCDDRCWGRGRYGGGTPGGGAPPGRRCFRRVSCHRRQACSASGSSVKIASRTMVSSDMPSAYRVGGVRPSGPSVSPAIDSRIDESASMFFIR